MVAQKSTMKIQIFEAYAGGHYTQYVAHLLPNLKELSRRGLIDSVVLTTSKNHVAHPYYAEAIAPIASGVTIDAPFSIGPHGPNSGREIAGLLRASIVRNRPDFVIATSADHGAFPLAVINSVAGSRPFGKASAIGIFHHGLGREPKTLTEALKDRALHFAKRNKIWAEAHIVNPLLFDRIERLGDGPAGHFRQLPDPVPHTVPIDRIEARAIFGIPETGRYIGHVGGMDARMALPELIEAFRSASKRVDDRLLLAGSLYEPYQAYVSANCADLIESKKLIVLDRFLTQNELTIAASALDVIAIPYYTTEQLSAKLLHAIAARRPVVSGALGYSGMIVQTFGVGRTCDIHDPADFARTIALALEESKGYLVSEKTERLIQYHAPENYAASVLHSLYERLGVERPPVKSWNWALTGS